MTYKLTETKHTTSGWFKTTCYVFEKESSNKKWIIYCDADSKDVISVICTGSYANFKNRKHCIPKVVNQFIDELKLAVIL